MGKEKLRHHFFAYAYFKLVIIGLCRQDASAFDVALKDQVYDLGIVGYETVSLVKVLSSGSMFQIVHHYQKQQGLKPPPDKV